jgi:mRNA interferase RelE/StbE
MVKYKIEFKKSAVKELNSVSPIELKKIIIRIQNLALNPRPDRYKKLSKDEKYRIRIGNYRILYLIEDDKLIIVIVKIGHRKDVYHK